MNTKKTKILKINPEKPEESIIKEAAQIIKNGGLVIFPTDTVYGLGANALLPEAVKRIYEIKKRSSNKPIILLLARKNDVKKLGVMISSSAKALMSKFWPGPLTLIFKTQEGTIGLRMPKNKIALELIKKAGIPVATTSANISGKKSVLTASGAIRQLKGKVDLIIDAGKSKLGIESTIVDVTVSPPKILREGYISKKTIWKVLND